MHGSVIEAAIGDSL